MTRPGISLASNASQQPWKVDADPRTLSKKFSPGFTKLRACPEITHTVALGAESFSDERQHSSHHPGRIEEKDAFETYTAISFNFDSLILGQALTTRKVNMSGQHSAISQSLSQANCRLSQRAA